MKDKIKSRSFWILTNAEKRESLATIKNNGFPPLGGVIEQYGKKICIGGIFENEVNTDFTFFFFFK